MAGGMRGEIRNGNEAMAKSDKQFEGVEVEIFGQSYRIGGEPEKIQPAAEYVDRKMHEIVENHDARRLPNLQVAILAAMEIAAEFLNLEKERKEFADKANESFHRLTKRVKERADLPDGGSDEQDPPVERRLRDTLGVEDSTPGS